MVCAASDTVLHSWPHQMSFGAHHYLHQGDLRVASGPDVQLVTVLGSCVAVCLWSARSKVGGMNHALLPEPPSGAASAGKYTRTATVSLLERFDRAGVARSSTVAQLFGGASMGPAGVGRGIGARNVEVAEEVLRMAGIAVVGRDVNGRFGRRIRFDVGSGDIRVDLLRGTSDVKKRILIVDDSPTVLMLHRTVLQDEGFEVLTAKNGRDGVELAVRERPDAVLLDLVMPVMDGIEALRLLREAPETKATPVVIVTTRSEEMFASAAMMLGCSGYLLKPFNRADLSATLRGLLTPVDAGGSRP